MNRDIVQQVAAKGVVFDKSGRILILRESGAEAYITNTQSGKWQLPGGRVEKGEKFQDALIREITEETSLNVEVKSPILVGEWRPNIRGKQHQIIGIFVSCFTATTDVVLSAEHDKYTWVSKENYKDYQIIQPDNQAIADFFASFKV